MKTSTSNHKKEEAHRSIIIREYYFKTLRKELRQLRLSLFKNKVLYVINYEKKKWAKNIFLVLVSLSALGGSWVYFLRHPNEIIQSKDNYVYIEDKTKTHAAFLKKLGELESNNNYKARRTGSKYLGRYQIGPEALNSIGIQVRDDIFLNTPQLQDLAMELLLRENKKTLAHYIGKWEGKKVGGLYITQSGILASAHLGGSQSVISYLESGGEKDFADGNNTQVSKYLRIFSGYKLNF